MHFQKPCRLYAISAAGTYAGLGVMVTRMFAALTRRNRHFRQVLPSELAVLGRHR